MDQEEQEERTELVSRMFALLTAKLEDAATLAAESQGRHAIAELIENASALRELVREALIVVDGVEALIR